jgi:hypothetical protein
MAYGPYTRIIPRDAPGLACLRVWLGGAWQRGVGLAVRGAFSPTVKVQILV